MSKLKAEEITYYYPDEWLFLGSETGILSNLYQKTIFACKPLLLFVSNPVFFFVDFVLKILFLKMPMHKIRKQKSEIFSFSFSLSKLCSVRYSSDNFFKQTQA